jgi:hypothetical protein
MQDPNKQLVYKHTALEESSCTLKIYIIFEQHKFTLKIKFYTVKKVLSTIKCALINYMCELKISMQTFALHTTHSKHSFIKVKAKYSCLSWGILRTQAIQCCNSLEAGP